MKKWFWTGIIRTKVRMDIQHLRKFLITLSSALHYELQRLEQSTENEIKKMNEEEREEYYDFIADEHWELKEVIPNLSYALILISLWALLEHTTVSLAKRIGASRGVKVKPNDLKEKGVEQARAYFSKVLEIPYPNNEKWQEIVCLRDIRNIIVHSDGIVTKVNKYDSLRVYIKRTDGLNTSGVNRIEIGEPYCRYAIGLVENYIFELIDNCEKSGVKNI